MSAPFNVLVFPGGTEIGLEIHASLRDCKEIRLFSAGLGVPNHAPFVFVHHAVVPSIYDPGWVDALNAVIKRWEIHFVIPAFDDVIVALAREAQRIDAAVISSPLETCLLTRSKSKTYALLKGEVPVPRMYASADAVDEFPVFVKPDQGQGSTDSYVVTNRNELLALLARRPDSIILEYLPGKEFTIDCFSDREAGLLFCGGRERVRTKSGISMSSRDVVNLLFEHHARAISQKMPLHGAWFFQMKYDKSNELKLLEIAPRIAGTMALHRVRGVNFPLLSIYEQMRIRLQILELPANIEIDRALTNRYRHDLKFSTVYVDLDDTLILNGRVNTRLVALLYQCLNKGKRLVLITRHTEDISATLARHRLTGLFDEIIHAPRPICKSLHITKGDAIFIDDSFSERKAVSQKCNIPVFDCSMIELLLDDRV